MSSRAPVQKSPPASLPERVRNYFYVGLAMSLVIHLVLGGFFVNYKPPKPEKQVVEKVDVTKKIKVVVPTPPPPTPTPPPPTPPPVSTPPPVVSTAPPPVKKIKLDVVKTHNNDKSSTTENTYVPPPKGDENGVPQGNAATGPPAPITTAPPATPAPPPPPTAPPTPVKPACAVPNQDASTLNKVDPDYPDAARAMSASGTVKVKVDLSETGSVTGVSVYQSAGNGALDQAALAAARESTYQPEIVDCVKTAKSYLFVAVFDPQ